MDNLCGGLGVDSPLVGSTGWMFHIGGDEIDGEIGLDSLREDVGVEF